MDKQSGKFNGQSNPAGGGGAFLQVEYLLQGAQIVRHTLWLHPKIQEQVVQDQEIRGFSGQKLYNRLVKLGAIHRDALRLTDGTLTALPDKEQGGGTGANVKISDIVPSEERFDPQTKIRYLWKHRDRWGELDDPLEGVAAVQETNRAGSHFTYIAHHKRGNLHDPPLSVSGHRIPAERCYDADGERLWFKHWDNGRNMDVDGEPAWERFSEHTHKPVAVIHVPEGKGKENDTNSGDFAEEYFNETTGECISALSIHDGKRRVVTPDELKKIHAPDDPMP